MKSLIGKSDASHQSAVFAEFEEGKIVAIITTNKLSHGIDIPNVKLVINYEVPLHAKEFLFRATRCGRLGIKLTSNINTNLLLINFFY